MGKRLIKILTIVFLCFVLLYLLLVVPTWPSKLRLCQDVEDYLPVTDCMKLNSRIEIVKSAFPEGSVTAQEVKKALGEYLHAEHQTSYGHREVYYLSHRPINYLIGYFASFDFRYDTNGILVAFSYDD